MLYNVEQLKPANYTHVVHIVPGLTLCKTCITCLYFTLIVLHCYRIELYLKNKMFLAFYVFCSGMVPPQLRVSASHLYQKNNYEKRYFTSLFHLLTSNVNFKAQIIFFKVFSIFLSFFFQSHER